MDRDAFIGDAIRALEALTTTSKSPERVYDQLCYDFPEIDDLELQQLLRYVYDCALSDDPSRPRRHGVLGLLLGDDRPAERRRGGRHPAVAGLPLAAAFDAGDCPEHAQRESRLVVARFFVDVDVDVDDVAGPLRRPRVCAGADGSRRSARALRFWTRHDTALLRNEQRGALVWKILDGGGCDAPASDEGQNDRPRPGALGAGRGRSGVEFAQGRICGVHDAPGRVGVGFGVGVHDGVYTIQNCDASDGRRGQSHSPHARRGRARRPRTSHGERYSSWPVPRWTWERRIRTC